MKLKKCLTLPTESNEWGDRIQTPDGRGELYHRSNGGKVLLVAHLDAVMWTKPRFKGGTVTCPQLDCRLGAWAILRLEKMLGCDILFTDEEESCASTAEFFPDVDDYSWVAEFDRRGTDVVMYDKYSDKYDELLTAEGFKIGHGSFSDICAFPENETMMFNFGCGYHSEHSHRCHANLNDTNYMIDKFVMFHNKYKNVPLYSPKSARTTRRYGTGLDPWGYSPLENDHADWKQQWNAGSEVLLRDTADCNTRGGVRWDGSLACLDCDDTGEILCPHCSNHHGVFSPCEKCDGLGTVVCPTCFPPFKWSDEGMVRGYK